MWRSLPFPSCGWVGGWVGMKKREMTQRGHFSSIEEGHRQGQRGEETRPPRTPSWPKAHFAAGWEEGVGAAGGRVGACLGLWPAGRHAKKVEGKRGSCVGVRVIRFLVFVGECSSSRAFLCAAVWLALAARSSGVQGACVDTPQKKTTRVHMHSHTSRFDTFSSGKRQGTKNAGNFRARADLPTGTYVGVRNIYIYV